MSLIPTAVKEYFRKAFIGCTLDEVVEELKKRGVTKVSLSGEGERALDSFDSPYNFYVHYLAETKVGIPVSIKEFADRTYSHNWRKDTNQRLERRKEVLQKEFGQIEVAVSYLPEKVRPYAD